MDGDEHHHLRRYTNRTRRSIGHRATVRIKKCKTVAVLLIFILLFIILNIQTILYVIQDMFLSENFNIRLCYHFNEEEDDSKKSEAMPRIIHQIDLTYFERNAPELYQLCQNSWIAKNQDYEYILWNSSMIETLIRKCYPSLLPVYEKYRGHLEIVKNIASYVVVHKMGGAYVDVDLVCKQGLNRLRRIMGEKTVMLSYSESPFGISNKFFMANKGHEFMAHVLDGLESSGVWYLAPFIESTYSTGSVFLAGRYSNYPHKDEVYLLPSHSDFVETVIFRRPWNSIDGKFIAIVWNGVDPVQLICVIFMIACIIRLTTLIKVRKNLYTSHTFRSARINDYKAYKYHIQ